MIFSKSGHDFFVILHALAASVGVGGVLVLDALFFKFLKDFRISHQEKDTLNTISKIFWVALLVLILTGIALFLPQQTQLLNSPKFLAKMIVVALLLLNGSFLNLFIAPSLEKISFHLPHHHQVQELHHYSKLAFVSGSVSLVSWLAAFVLGAIRSTALSLGQILILYLALLILAVIGSLWFEKFFELRYQQKNKPKP